MNLNLLLIHCFWYEFGDMGRANDDLQVLIGLEGQQLARVDILIIYNRICYCCILD